MSTLLAMRSKSNESLTKNLNTVGVQAQLQSLRPWSSNSLISESSWQITLTQIGIGKWLQGISLRDRSGAGNQQVVYFNVTEEYIQQMKE